MNLFVIFFMLCASYFINALEYNESKIIHVAADKCWIFGNSLVTHYEY